MSAVKSDHITRQQASHRSAERQGTATEKKVGMIGHQGLCITPCLRPRAEDFKSCNKVLTVFIVAENIPAFDSPDHDVVQNTRCI